MGTDKYGKIPRTDGGEQNRKMDYICDKLPQL